MIKFYTVSGGGRLTSCVGICLWLLEELQINYEIISLDLYNAEHKSEEFLKLNPNGKIPCIDDNGFLLWESVAINYHLARKYSPELLGNTLEEKALIDQWTLWMISEFQPLVTTIFRNASLPKEQKDHGLVQKSKYKIMQCTLLLENELSKRKNIVGNKFTMADINIAAIASIHKIIKTDLTEYPNFSRWLNVMLSRKSLYSLQQKKLIVIKLDD
ncbi:MAG: glutathione S-transferase family protein [Candidatus Sericytochromatia bacterium]|nr:glutathione S-transferase family protein [Candidatus Sericytochromatia bacterium]